MPGVGVGHTLVPIFMIFFINFYFLLLRSARLPLRSAASAKKGKDTREDMGEVRMDPDIEDVDRDVETARSGELFVFGHFALSQLFLLSGAASNKKKHISAKGCRKSRHQRVGRAEPGVTRNEILASFEPSASRGLGGSGKNGKRMTSQ